MFRKQPNSTHGAWHINTAQVIIILMAIACAVLVFNTYQDAHQPPPSLHLADAAARPDPRLDRYAAQVQKWQAKMAAQQTPVTWPYLGQPNVVRVDLPSLVPITLADWSDDGLKAAAKKSYYNFVSVRRTSRITDPEACIVHVFSATGEEVAQASASGVLTSEQQNLGAS